MAEIDRFLITMCDQGASDLHLCSDIVPMIRLHGEMMEIPGEPVMDSKTLFNVLHEIMPEKNRDQFKESRDTDFAYEIDGLGRFRSNIFMDNKGIGAVFRFIPSKILTAEDLNLSQAIKDMCYLSKGLVLVTGPTGSGKSTTLCAMIDLINRTRSDHIITIEDPIEFVHPNKNCLINQREVGVHTKSFKNALRAALREDPDIVLVGEMRDLETTEIAIETAETGHLVFGTLHTTTAASTVDRLIDQFPADRQDQIRTMLASSLKGVIAQNLLKKADGKGRVAALEVLVTNFSISSNIREGKTYQIPSAMQTGGKQGMVLLSDALCSLVTSGQVSADEAYKKAVNKEELLNKFKQSGIRFDPESISQVDVPKPKTQFTSKPAAAGFQPQPAAPASQGFAAPPAGGQGSGGFQRQMPASPPPAAPAPQPQAQPKTGFVDPFEEFRRKK